MNKFFSFIEALCEVCPFFPTILKQLTNAPLQLINMAYGLINDIHVAFSSPFFSPKNQPLNRPAGLIHFSRIPVFIDFYTLHRFFVQLRL